MPAKKQGSWTAGSESLQRVLIAFKKITPVVSLPQSRQAVPNETTEQPIIERRFGKKGAIGVQGLQAIARGDRPTGERLAGAAIGRPCDGQFKATLSHMVKMQWLDNGRLHGMGGGYFLTEAGERLGPTRRALLKKTTLAG